MLPAKTKNNQLIMLIVGLVAIAAIIVVAAYSWYGTPSMEPESGIEAETPTIDDIRSQSESTEAAAIEADLSAQSPDSFDQEITDAFADIEAELQ